MNKIMTVEFELNEQDFLDFLLFSASQSKRVREQKIQGRIVMTALFAALSLVFYSKNNNFMAICFGTATIVGALFYPKYFAWRYKRHYKAHIRENYLYRFGKKVHIEINSQTIYSKEKTGEGTINISEIEKIDETEKHFFVKIKSGDTFIIPKNQLPNCGELRTTFEALGFAIKIHNEY